MAKINVTGISPDELAGIRERGIDQGGNPVEPFVDADGGWPLRCCLTDSTPGERIAIVAWSPFPWKSPYRELGPIVIHADDCPTRHDGSFPAQFDDRRQVLRPYGFDRRIAYDRLVMVDARAGLVNALVDLLDDPTIEFVQVRNALSGCYSFTATRSAHSVI
jgi:Protein of unknown function (DUF1203)